MLTKTERNGTPLRLSGCVEYLAISQWALTTENVVHSKSNSLKKRPWANVRIEKMKRVCTQHKDKQTYMHGLKSADMIISITLTHSVMDMNFISNVSKCIALFWLELKKEIIQHEDPLKCIKWSGRVGLAITGYWGDYTDKSRVLTASLPRFQELIFPTGHFFQTQL